MLDDKAGQGVESGRANFPLFGRGDSQHVRMSIQQAPEFTDEGTAVRRHPESADGRRHIRSLSIDRMADGSTCKDAR